MTKYVKYITFGTKIASNRPDEHDASAKIIASYDSIEDYLRSIGPKLSKHAARKDKTPTFKLQTSEDIAEKDLVKSVQRALDITTLLSMATVNEDDTPHINTAFFACMGIGLDMVFLSDPNTKHIKNIAARPDAAITVFSTQQDWDDDKLGLQLFGKVINVKDNETILAYQAYRKAFPAYAEWIDKEDENEHKSVQDNLYIFVPLRVIFSSLETFIIFIVYCVRSNLIRLIIKFSIYSRV